MMAGGVKIQVVCLEPRSTTAFIIFLIENNKNKNKPDPHVLTHGPYNTSLNPTFLKSLTVTAPH